MRTSFAHQCAVTVTAAAWLALGFSGSALSDPIKSVCATDDQTLRSVKASPDQTLWLFMQTVCRGEFAITRIANESAHRELPQAIEVVQPTNVQPIVVAQPTDAPQTLGLDASTPLASALPEAVAETPVSPEVELAKTAVHPLAIQDSSPNVASSHGHVSKRPWLYTLLNPQTIGTIAENLPAPIEYKASRFSDYRPDYPTEAIASAQAKGLLQKPGVMSVVPQGLYLGTSFSRSRAADKYSALPSFILGYANEKAVREFQSYPGLGSRFDVKVQRLEDRSDRTKWNRYSTTGEVYLPLGRGFFTGLGGRYQFDKDISVLGEGNHDTDAWHSYLPIGIGFTNSDGHSGKIQINTLIQARTKAKLSQLASATYSDAIAKLHFGDAYGLDFSYAWTTNSEAFVHYWWYSESDSFTYTRNGVRVSQLTPKQRTVDVGFRYYW